MADTLSLYKLIILKMLEQVEYPLTNSQITEFILDKEYTNYFTVQQALSEMDETGLVNVTTKRNNSLYHLTFQVPSKKQAESACSHWAEKSQNIYATIMKELL